MTEKLLPCPFCGGKAEIERPGTAKQSCIIACDNCGCRLETGEVWSMGERWNSRRDPSIAQAPGTERGYTEAEGYAASLRQMAQWVDEANADPCGHGVIGMEDIDADELRAAADFIVRAGVAQTAVTSGTLTFGALVENIAASDRNPIKRGIFIRKTSAKMAEYATKEGCHSTPLDNLRASNQGASK